MAQNSRRTTSRPEPEEQEPPVGRQLALSREASTQLDVGDELEGLTGLGYSERAEDAQIPILSILQDNSGEVKKKHSKYLDGAEPGMMIVRSLGRLYEGEPEKATLIVQPCGFQHVWVEWNGEPGEGAPVAQYPFDDRPGEAFEEEDPQNPDRKIWRMPGGNRLVDTRYHYCNVLSDENVFSIVIPMSGTNHGVSRQWTAQMKQFRVPGTDAKAPAWFRAYKLTTAFIQRDIQSWYKYALQDLGWVTDKALRQLGRELYDGVAAERVVADIEAEANDLGEGAASDKDGAPI